MDKHIFFFNRVQVYKGLEGEHEGEGVSIDKYKYFRLARGFISGMRGW
jgi:hypothetical protein